jgi:hypothetical protein
MTQKRIFISYAREDTTTVDRFYRLAKANGYSVYMDVYDIKPGPWKLQIESEIARSQIFLVFLSKHVQNKIDNQSGFVESELNYAYNIAMRTPPSEFQIIPIRLDQHYRGDLRASMFHQYDLCGEFASQATRILSAIDRTSPRQKLIDRASTYYAARDFVNA